MTATLMTDMSVGNWMLTTPDQTQVRIEKAVTQSTVGRESARRLQTLGVVARRALAQEIEAKLRAVLSETLADLVLGGWRTYGAVAEAVRKSRARPGVTQIVPLRNHVIVADRQHRLDVEVDGLPVMSLTARATVRLQLFAAVAVVQDGYVTAIRSGQATVNGALSVEGVDVSHKTLTFPLEAELVMRRVPQATVPTR